MCNDNTLNTFNSADYLPFKNTLTGFVANYYSEDLTRTENVLITFSGEWSPPEEALIYPKCGNFAHKHNSHTTTIKHIPIGSYLSEAEFVIYQYQCPVCGKTFTPQPGFKHENHRISYQLFNYIEQQLATNFYTLKNISQRTGVCANVIKEIDKARLLKKYTINGEKLKPPDKQAYAIGIDEFKLHNHHKYATHIIDLETGDILYIAHGKKKQVVYDFFELVGDEYMKKIRVLACDMNSDFYEAFKEYYPHIDIVFDYFHVVKNFNDKVVSAVRKDEYKRLMEEGKFEAARRLKGTKYILTASRKTLAKYDKEREEEKVINKGSILFNMEPVVRTKEYMRTYNLLICENTLFMHIDLIKDYLDRAFHTNDTDEMHNCLVEIVTICEESKNKHFEWFARLIKNHYEGLLNHSRYCISNGKIEGINNKIKTIRRMGYGYPDDQYFFLKLIDMSRIKNSVMLKSHKKS